MGSISVYTGRLLERQAGSILSDKKFTEKNPDKGRLGQVSIGGRIPDRVIVKNEDGTHSYTINFEDVRVPEKFRDSSKYSYERQQLERDKVKEAYMRVLRGSSNTDNSQSTYTKVYNEAISKGRTPEQARDLAERARSRVAMAKAQNVLNNANFVNRYGRNTGIRVYSRRKL